MEAEFGWMICSWDQKIGAKRMNNRVMRMTFKKLNADRVMDRTAAVPKKYRFREYMQMHVLTGEQASPQSCKLDDFHC